MAHQNSELGSLDVADRTASGFLEVRDWYARRLRPRVVEAVRAGRIDLSRAAYLEREMKALLERRAGFSERRMGDTRADQLPAANPGSGWEVSQAG